MARSRNRLKIGELSSSKEGCKELFPSQVLELFFILLLSHLLS
jgi:hypothetical protein